MSCQGSTNLVFIFFAIELIPLSRADQYLAMFNQARTDAVALGLSSASDAVSFDGAARARATATQTALTSQRSGTCVKVRVRLVQEMTLTRTAFNAQLQIQNDGDVDMTNIRVDLEFYRRGDTTTLRNSLFVIGNPDPVFVGGVSGNGTVRSKTSGLTAW
jgi:hypothetical protein